MQKDTQTSTLGPRLFRSETIHATPGITAAFPEERKPWLFQCLDRHFSGDWGDTGTEKDSPDELSDSELNDFALLDGSRIFSVYHCPADLFPEGKIWIITDSTDGPHSAGPRQTTCIMFPSEY